MGFLDRWRHRSGSRSLINSLDDYATLVSYFNYGGTSYPVGLGAGVPNIVTTMGVEKAEPISDNFVGHVQSAFKANGVIFACMVARQLAFSAVRFTYQRINTGHPSELFGDQSLALLEAPWPSGTTQDMLSRLIQDADLAGSAYHTLDTPLARLDGDRGGQEIVRLRPDWIVIILGERRVQSVFTDDNGNPLPATLGMKRLGYIYVQDGMDSGENPVFLPVQDVSHFAPIPDPEATYRGMSWVTPLIREVQADQLMTRHRIKFFENGATPNLVITHAAGATPEKVRRWKEQLGEQYAGIDNAYKTMNLYPGADLTPVGVDFQQLEFKVTQGAGETRIAAAARIPPVIVGLSEGLEAATYSNYGQARRAFADGTMHPMWGNVAGSFAPLRRRDIARLTAAGPGTVRLWYDATDVPLLREDAKEAAGIQRIQQQTIRGYIEAGFTPDSARRAVLSNDLRLLDHTGFVSVQLQHLGSGVEDSAGES